MWFAVVLHLVIGDIRNVATNALSPARGL